MWCPRGLDCLRLLPRVSWGEEFEGRVLNGAFHRERKQSRDAVHPELGRVKEERGANESRNRVRPYHFLGEFGVFLSHWSLRWVFGTRGVHRMVSAATRGSLVLKFSLTPRWEGPGAFLSLGSRDCFQRREFRESNRSWVGGHVVEEFLVVRKLLVHYFLLYGLLYGVTRVSFTDRVLSRRGERSKLSSNEASIDRGPVSPEPES